MKPKYSETGIVQREERVASPCVLYRASTMEDYEKKAMEKYFVCEHSRMDVHGGDLVVGRYSVLPFYKELEEDLLSKGAKLINSFRQHRYVADLQNYVQDLGSLTPPAWRFSEYAYIPDVGGSYIVKGETNSRKDKWKTHMFAKDKEAVKEVAFRLLEDSLFADQELYVRPFIPLETLATGINDQPITLEFRFFVCHGEIVSGAFYWSSFVDDLESVPQASMVPEAFLRSAIDKVKDNVNFFVMDVAKAQNGDWIVVELNDGQMSGLSENDPNILYKNLKNVLWDRHQET